MPPSPALPVPASPELLELMERAADGVEGLLAYVDDEERYRYVNGTYGPWLGREPAELVGRAVREVVGEVAYPRLVPHLRAALSGQRVRFTHRLRYANGLERVVEAVYTPHVLADGRVAGFVAFARDVSAILEAEEARRQALAAVVEKELLLEAVLQQLPCGVIIRGAGGELTLSNARAAALLGQAPARAQPELASALTWLDGRPLPREAWAMERALRGEATRDAYVQYQPPAGEPRVLRTSGAPVFDHAGAQRAAVLTFDDVTEERRAASREATLLAALQDLAEGSPDLYAALDALAARLAHFFGDACALTLADAAGERLEVAALGHPLPEARAALAHMARAHYGNPAGLPMQVLRTGRAVRVNHVPQEGLAERMAPMTRPFVERFGLHHLLIVPLRAQGQVIGTLGVSRGRAEAPYTQDDQDFLQVLADRAGLLVHNARLLAKTREAVHARDEFLSVAGHELRTPLTSLRLQLQLMQRRLADGSPEAMGGKLDTALRQVDRLTQLVGSLLDVSRIEMGRLELHAAEADLARLVHDAVERLGDAFRFAGCALTVDALPTTGTWDTQRLDQVVVNLLSNAAKYGARQPVQLRVRPEGAWALLEVQDGGIGIAAEDVPRLFQRFERAVSGRHYGGLGLGLYIARRLVEAMGGTIAVASEPGVGSTFTVRLPRRTP